MRAFCHPLFQRERPELASEIVHPVQVPARRLTSGGIKAQRPVENHQVSRRSLPSDPAIQSYIADSMQKAQKELGNVVYPRETYECRPSFERRAESELPPSVRIAALRDGLSSSKKPSAPSRPVRANCSRRKSSQSKSQDVVDLTEDNTGPYPQDPGMYGAPSGYYEQFQGIPPSPVMGPFTSGQKRKLNIFEDARAMDAESLMYGSGQPPFVTPEKSTKMYQAESYMGASGPYHLQQQERQYLKEQQRRRFGLSSPLGLQPSADDLREAEEDARALRPGLQALEAERAARMHRQQQQAMAREEERALLMQQAALEQQALQERLARSRERTAIDNMRREAEIVVAQDVELEKRRRLSSALFGSGTIKKKKQKVDPAANAPKEPPSAEPNRPSPPEMKPQPPAPKQQLQFQQQQLEAESDNVINAIRNPASASLPGMGAAAGAAGFDPYMAAMLQQQQQLAMMTGGMPFFPGAAAGFDPSTAFLGAAADPSLEFMLQSMQQR